MADDTAESWTLIPIKEKEDGSNNYAQFKFRSTCYLRAVGYLKYIEDSNPPVIPKLCPPHRIQGLDAAGNNKTITIPSNEVEVANAEANAKHWRAEDQEVLALIVQAVPVEKRYVVNDCHTAHEAWEALRNEYEFPNKLIAMDIMRQMIGMPCGQGDDPVRWLCTMRQLRSKLCAASMDLMPDSEYAVHLVMLMSKDPEWRYCRDSLLHDLVTASAEGRPLSSSVVIERLRDKEIDLGIAPCLISIKNLVASARTTKRHDNAVPSAHSAGGAPAPSDNRQRRQGRRPAPYSSRPQRRLGSPVGHVKENCFSYGGGKAGQYPPDWNGRKDIHLSPDARIASRHKAAVEKLVSMRI
ncbi:hypothetical protein BDP27DRAFT_1315787 [Rhodocollybia butyracea]|uniref:Gag protein n=1 Tax=Rhodocollybia butyracea TaxID=206335 RepID=A0A9P5Q4G3_9AGAR|nr:hypothetical protein BDP27DRAFT_1315787 [Rhodocollybia butyracea]